MAGRGTENTCIHSGDLKSKVWGAGAGGAPPEHLFELEEEGGREEGREAPAAWAHNTCGQDTV